MKKRFFLITITGLLLLLVAACGGNDEQESNVDATSGDEWVPDKEFITIAGGVAGSWPPTAAKYAELITKSIDGVTANAQPGTTEENLINVATGQADIGFSMGYAAVDAINGERGFEQKYEDIQHLASINTGTLQIMVRSDGDIKTLDDLKTAKGIKITHSGPNSFQNRVTTTILDIIGTSYEDIEKRGGVISQATLADGISMMQNGQVDISIQIGPYPYSLFMELENTVDVQLVPIEKEVLEELKKRLPGFVDTVVPTGSYKSQTEDYPTISTPYMLFVNKNLSEELVYRLTAALYDNEEEIQTVGSFGKEITLENALVAPTVEIHPGAKRYYEEHGIEIIE